MSDMVKQKSAGYASLNYEEAGYRKADLVKVEIAVNGKFYAYLVSPSTFHDDYQRRRSLRSIVIH